MFDEVNYFKFLHEDFHNLRVLEGHVVPVQPELLKEQSKWDIGLADEPDGGYGHSVAYDLRNSMNFQLVIGVNNPAIKRRIKRGSIESGTRYGIENIDSIIANPMHEGGGRNGDANTVDEGKAVDIILLQTTN